MEIPGTVSIQQRDARDDLSRTLAFSRKRMSEARETALNDKEAPIAVDPLHPALLGGHEVARQVGPHA
eukprot:11050339-Alexandrium_andersonii.AAC.1